MARNADLLSIYVLRGNQAPILLDLLTPGTFKEFGIGAEICLLSIDL
jgi:hypothetical protein